MALYTSLLNGSLVQISPNPLPYSRRWRGATDDDDDTLCSNRRLCSKLNLRILILSAHCIKVLMVFYGLHMTSLLILFVSFELLSLSGVNMKRRLEDDIYIKTQKILEYIERLFLSCVRRVGLWLVFFFGPGYSRRPAMTLSIFSSKCCYASNEV